MILSKKITKEEKNILETPEVKNTIYQSVLAKKDGDPPFLIKKFTIGPTGRIPLHSHKWSESLYVLEGNGTMHESQSKAYSHLMSPDMIFSIPPLVYHEISNYSQMKSLVLLSIIPSFSVDLGGA
jgi:quercetin dioxygenase-like cupin family protein